MRHRRTFKYAIFFVPSALFIACAADPGDVLKLGESATSQSTGSVSTTGGNTGGTTGQNTGGTSTTTTGTETSSPTGGTTSTSTGSTSTNTGGNTSTSTESSVSSGPDAGEGDDGGEEGGTTVGAGCAAGATVIVLTFSSGTNGNTGNFNTTGAVCVELMGSVHMGWGVSNPGTRMVTLTSASGTAGPVAASSIATLPQAPQAGTDGFVYWNFTADNSNPPIDYTSIYVF